MKELLFKNYDINLEHYEDYNGGLLFVVAGVKYLFVKCDYNEAMLDGLNREVSRLIRYNIKLHTLIKNNNGEYLSNGYVLMMVNVIDDEISLYDIGLFNSVLVDSNEKYNDMNSFWYRKIDYIEQQVHDLSSNLLINNSIDYYIGISEMILANLNNHLGISKITLSHKYLKNLSSLEYYNPLNMSYDVWLKDICYYVKYKNDYKYMEKIIDCLSDYEINYVFSRFCFPFDYFEEISDVILNKKNEGDLLRIVTNVDVYEQYLFDMERFFNIYIFEWIKK